MSTPDPTAPDTKKATDRATTARTLAVVAGVCLVLALAIGSPAGAMFLAGLGALFALPAMLLARARTRIVAALLLALNLGLALDTYPKYRAHMDAYAERAKR